MFAWILEPCSYSQAELAVRKASSSGSGERVTSILDDFERYTGRKDSSSLRTRLLSSTIKGNGRKRASARATHLLPRQLLLESPGIVCILLGILESTRLSHRLGQHRRE